MSKTKTSIARSFLTAREAAELCGCATGTIYAQVKKGQLECFVIGKGTLIIRAADARRYDPAAPRTVSRETRKKIALAHRRRRANPVSYWANAIVGNPDLIPPKGLKIDVPITVKSS